MSEICIRDILAGNEYVYVIQQIHDDISQFVSPVSVYLSRGISFLGTRNLIKASGARRQTKEFRIGVICPSCGRKAVLQKGA